MDMVMLDFQSSTIVQDMSRWSEPLVADEIHAEYNRRLGKSEISEAFGRRHCRMWGFMLQGDASRAQSTHRELLKLCNTVNLDCAALGAINATVLSNLLSVIRRRARCSRYETREACQRLLDAVAMVK
jgi:hypothetical protein